MNYIVIITISKRGRGNDDDDDDNYDKRGRGNFYSRFCSSAKWCAQVIIFTARKSSSLNLLYQWYYLRDVDKFLQTLWFTAPRTGARFHDAEGHENMRGVGEASQYLS